MPLFARWALYLAVLCLLSLCLTYLHYDLSWIVVRALLLLAAAVNLWIIIAVCIHPELRVFSWENNNYMVTGVQNFFTSVLLTSVLALIARPTVPLMTHVLSIQGILVLPLVIDLTTVYIMSRM